MFDYQEVAIIRKFNQALQNLDVFVKHEHWTAPRNDNQVKEVPSEIQLQVNDTLQH